MAEKRIVLQHCGFIDPGDISGYIKNGGFKALAKARKMGPEAVVAEVKAAKLKGRGGAGFPCGVKWEMARQASGDEKFLICNADEGEVGAFKDRYMLQKDPFSLIEGIAIASYAIGAQKAYLYLRAEYHYLQHIVKGAIKQAAEKGILQNLELEVKEGAGAYVCGEESALMNSIEGRRGEARFKPPFPPASGLFGQPTIINNVETLMNIPFIILQGAAWFAGMGTAESTGTKVFSVSGDVERPGVYEVVLGSKLSEIVTELAGAKDLGLVQVGGATGNIVPAAMIDIPLSYETVLGAGAITVLNSTRDVIDYVYRTMLFLNEESCGKCTPCREGTEVLVEVLGRLANGAGMQGDIEALTELAKMMQLSSLCGLGQTAPIPVLDSLKYFKNDYENRIKQSVFLRKVGFA